MAPMTATATPAQSHPERELRERRQQTKTFVSVPAGNSTTISDWTVVTPALYSDSGRGSVDLTSKHYFNAEDGKYSIDLAGSTGVPGGVYQNVATTPGVEYSLTFWSGVNGDEKPGMKHTMAVSVNGSALDTVKAVSVGLPGQLGAEHGDVHRIVDAPARSSSPTQRPRTSSRDPRVDNVSLVAVPDVITASPVTIPDQTTGVSFTRAGGDIHR